MQYPIIWLYKFNNFSIRLQNSQFSPIQSQIRPKVCTHNYQAQKFLNQRNKVKNLNTQEQLTTNNQAKHVYPHKFTLRSTERVKLWQRKIKIKEEQLLDLRNASEMMKVLKNLGVRCGCVSIFRVWGRKIERKMKMRGFRSGYAKNMEKNNWWGGGVFKGWDLIGVREK